VLACDNDPHRPQPKIIAQKADFTYQCFKIFSEVDKHFLFTEIVGEYKDPVIFVLPHHFFESIVGFLSGGKIVGWIGKSVV